MAGVRIASVAFLPGSISEKYTSMLFGGKEVRNEGDVGISVPEDLSGAVTPEEEEEEREGKTNNNKMESGKECLAG